MAPAVRPMRDGSRWIAAAEPRTGQSRFRRLTGGEGREDREDPRQPGRARSDDRTRTPADHRVSRTGPSAVPGAGSDRRRGRDLEPAAVPDQEPSDGNAGRDLHARLGRQGAACHRDAAHPRSDRARRHPPGAARRGQQEVQAAAERGAARKLYPVRAQDQISARRDLRLALEDRQRRGFLFRRLLFRGPNHSAAATHREPVSRQARDPVPAQRRQLLPLDAQHVGGLSQQHGLAQEFRSAQVAAVARAAGRERRACRFRNTTSSRSMRPGSARR